MGKPTGMTSDLRIVIPKTWEDKVWEAVDEAHSAGVTATQLRREVVLSWIEISKRQIKADQRELEREI